MGIKRVLKRVGKAIEWPFKEAFKALFSQQGRRWLQSAYQAALQTPLGKIVDQVVKDVALLPLDGTEKHAEAIKRIIAAATKAKLVWKESLVNTMIELAVQALKGNI